VTSQEATARLIDWLAVPVSHDFGEDVETVFCRCGAQCSMGGSPLHGQRHFDEFSRKHQGEGHGPCGLAECMEGLRREFNKAFAGRAEMLASPRRDPPPF
jgi:hypothetical protein